MTDLPLTGVQLVAQGHREYIDAIKKSGEANSTFNQVLQNAGAGFKFFNTLATAAAVSVGVGLVGAIGVGVSKLVQLSSGAINAASTLQDVQLNIESLTAAELLSSGATDDMNEAIAAAGPIASDVMERLKKLSLASPFEYQQILQVYQLNKAFGQSTDMSLELTQAITNLAAANKSVPGITERLAYNFSQMAMTGQITARDMRDLAMAGVNLEKVFSDQLGMSVDEVNDKLKSGQMTFEEVSQSFADYVDKYFGNAAERASKTFSGLKSSFNDLAFFSSIDIFGESLNAVTASMGGLFDRAQQFIQAGGLKPIGATLGVLTEELMGLAETGFNAGQAFFDQFGGQIMATASSALEWGMNVTMQLATGLIEGAATGLTMAMNYVSDMLSFFLAPGSPPRVAPDIDSWGTQAMEEYLKGFTDADFSALNSIEAGINSALGALSGAGVISKDDTSKMLQNLSKQVTGVLAGQTELSPVLDSIRSSLGDYGASVSDLVVKQIALAAATNKVKKAEEDLKKFRADEEAANSDLVRIIDDYNESAKEGASPAVLAAKREEFLLAKQRRNEAAKGRAQAEKDLETGKAEMDGLKERASLQSSLVTELVELTKVQKDLAAAMKGAGAAKMGGAKAGAGKMPDLSKVTGDMQAKMEELKETLRTKLKDTFKPLSDSFKKARDIIVPAWERFSTTISDFYNKYIKPVSDKLKEIIPPDLVKNIGEVVGIALGLGAAFGVVAGVVGIVTAAISAISWPILAIIAGLALLKTAWDNDWLGIQTTLTNVWESYLKPAFENIKVWLGENIPKALEAISTFWNTTLKPALVDIGEWFSKFLPAATSTLADYWMLVLIPALQSIWTWFSVNIIPVFQQVGTAVSTHVMGNFQVLADLFNNVLIPALQAVWTWVSTWILPIFVKLNEIFQAVLLVNLQVFTLFLQEVLIPAFQAVWNFMVNVFHPAFMAFNQFLVDLFIANFRTLTDLWNNAVLPAASAIGSYVGDTLGPVFTNLWATLAEKLRPIFEWFHTFFVQKLYGALEKLFLWLDKVRQQVLDLAAALSKLVIPGQLQSHSPSPFEMTLRNVYDAMHKLNYSSLPAFKTNLDRIGEAGERAFSMDAAAAKYELMVQKEPAVSRSESYNLTLETAMQPETVRQGFEYFRILGA